MLKDVQEVEVVRTYKAVYEGKPVMFSLSKDIYDLQEQYKILEYADSKEVPRELEKKLLSFCEDIDLGEVESL